MTKFVPATLETGGAHAIARYLRDIGPSEVLDEQLELEGPGEFRKILPLPSDAFKIWEQNYQEFGNTGMAKRVKILERAFYGLLDRGMPKQSVRVFDHGVSGGLLLLKGSTFWFRFKFGLDRAALRSPASKRLKKRIEKTFTHQYRAEHWWRSAVWATAAVAIYNVQQSRYRKEWGKKTKLRLSDDPLAYLRILVDILQEWDRHSMQRIRSVEAGPRRINSRDVQISTMRDGKVIIQYGCRDKDGKKGQSKMRSDLSDALVGWPRLVKVSFHPL